MRAKCQHTIGSQARVVFLNQNRDARQWRGTDPVATWRSHSLSQPPRRGKKGWRLARKGAACRCVWRVGLATAALAEPPQATSSLALSFYLAHHVRGWPAARYNSRPSCEGGAPGDRQRRLRSILYELLRRQQCSTSGQRRHIAAGQAVSDRGAVGLALAAAPACGNFRHDSMVDPRHSGRSLPSVAQQGAPPHDRHGAGLGWGWEEAAGRSARPGACVL